MLSTSYSHTIEPSWHGRMDPRWNSCETRWYCWWFRNPVNSPVEVGSFPHYLQGFIHPRWWSPDFWTINSVNSITRAPNNYKAKSFGLKKRFKEFTTTRHDSPWLYDRHPHVPRPDSLSFPSLLSRLRDFSLRSCRCSKIHPRTRMNKIYAHDLFICLNLQLQRLSSGANALDS